MLAVLSGLCRPGLAHLVPCRCEALCLCEVLCRWAQCRCGVQQDLKACWGFGHLQVQVLPQVARVWAGPSWAPLAFPEVLLADPLVEVPQSSEEPLTPVLLPAERLPAGLPPVVPCNVEVHLVLGLRMLAMGHLVPRLVLEHPSRGGHVLEPLLGLRCVELRRMELHHVGVLHVLAHPVLYRLECLLVEEAPLVCLEVQLLELLELLLVGQLLAEELCLPWHRVHRSTLAPLQPRRQRLAYSGRWAAALWEAPAHWHTTSEQREHPWLSYDLLGRRGLARSWSQSCLWLRT